VLYRKVSDKRIFPSLDVGKSGTRKEELLVDQSILTKMWVLRRILMQMGTIDAMQFLLDKMKDAKSNEDFFASMNQ
jgi:transcription termination factor Rho